MQELIDVFSSLQINTNFESQAMFDEFKANILSNLTTSEIDLLKKLKVHHTNTLFHNIIVSKDTFCIAKSLNLSEDKCISLALAGLFHDIGKLDIHNLVLDLSSTDVNEIWLMSHDCVVLPRKGVCIKDITLDETITYLSSLSSDAEKFKIEFLNWLENKSLSSFLNLSIREYLNQHQLSTKNILKEAGFANDIIIYASSHHLNYFSDFEQNKLPGECNVIEIADKFNAISQSEGIRIYAQRKSHCEAIMIIIKGFEGEFNVSSQEDCFKVEILKILSNKYLYDDFNSLKIKIEKFKTKLDNFDKNDIPILRKKYSLMHNELEAFSFLNKSWQDIFKIEGTGEFEILKKDLIHINNNLKQELKNN